MGGEPVHSSRLGELEDRVRRFLAAANIEISPRTDAALRDALASVREDVERSLQTFVRIHEALARLRQHPSVETIVQAAPREVADACDFDRVAIYRVAGPDMLCEATYIRGDPDEARAMLEYSREHPGKFAEQILETEMIRRRIPMIVRDALNHPSTPKSLVERYGTTCYVAAPIMPEGRVIGFVHADTALRHPGDTDCLDEFDRDALWAFAESLGYAIERAELVERLHRQGQELQRLVGETQAVVAEYLETKVELVSGAFDSMATTRTATAIFAGSEERSPESPEQRLTRREIEVLELLAHGVSNLQIAARLFISESTAKSHVASILRKLGAANRVEATSIYLRARGRAGD